MEFVGKRRSWHKENIESRQQRQQQSSELRWRFHIAAKHVLRQQARPSDLYRVIETALTSAGFGNDIEEAMKFVREAVELVSSPKNLNRLYNQLGYRRPKNHYITIATAVAALDLDNIDGNKGVEKHKTKGNSNNKGKKNPDKNDTTELKPKDRVASVITALLQEFVAYDVISIEEIDRKFGGDSEISQLIREASRITKIRVNMRMPDDQGRLSLYRIRNNMEQEELSRDLILFTKNSSRVGIIKIIDAFTQLCNLGRIQLLNDEESLEKIKMRTALHIRGMYLPLVREIGVFEIQNEMEELLVSIMDPKSAAEILKQRNRIASLKETLTAEKRIRKALEESGFGMGSIVKIKGGRKSVYSIWNKLLMKEFEKGKNSNLFKRVFYSKLEEVNITSIYDCLRFRIIIKDSFGIDGYPDVEANRRRLEHLNSIFANLYQEVPGRFKDYLYPNHKPNGYQALQNTFYLGDIEYKGRMIPQYLELHFVTESMEKINECSHAAHKLRPCGREEGIEFSPIAHPSALLAPLRGMRNFLLKDTIERMWARISKGTLPEHANRRFVIVSDRKGTLLAFPKGTTRGDVVKWLIGLKRGGVCGADGKIIRPDHGSSLEDYTKKVMDLIGKDKIARAKDKLSHADILENIIFPQGVKVAEIQLREYNKNILATRYDHHARP